MRPVCLSIGGSDSCGGAGVQADLRVFDAVGVHGCSAITALTAQNPRAVTRIEPVSLAQLDAEIHAIYDYYDVAVVKTGMLVDAERVAVAAALIAERHRGPLVVDPVMISSSGRSLLDEGGLDALRHALLPLADLVTPNLDEAAVLLGEKIEDAERAATVLAERLGCAVLLKGGHALGETVTDLLCDGDGETHRFNHARQPWGEADQHGTGCRLASAIAAYLATGKSLAEAAALGVAFLQSS